MGRPAKPMDAPEPALEAVADGALSPDGAAAFTSFSRREIDRAIGRGEIETFRHGRRVLVAKNEARRWLAAMLEASRAEVK